MYWNTDFNQGLIIQLQTICPFVGINRSNDTIISPVLRVINEMSIICLLIRFGSPKLKLLRLLVKRLFFSVITLLLK